MTCVKVNAVMVFPDKRFAPMTDRRHDQAEIAEFRSILQALNQRKGAVAR